MQLEVICRPQLATASFDQSFSALPRLLRKDPFHVGLLPDDVWTMFLTVELPGPKNFWIIKHQSKVIGRIGASVSVFNKELGTLGFFEVDVGHHLYTQAAQMLIETGIAWLQQQAAVKRIIGPINFNTWFSYRFRVKPVDDLIFSWEPVNPPAYLALFKAQGFSPQYFYDSRGFDGLAQVEKRSQPGLVKATGLGYTFRPFDLSAGQIEKEVALVHRISLQGFGDQHFFEPIPATIFKQIYVPIAQKGALEYAFFAQDPSGQEIGFMYGFADGDYIVFKSTAVKPEHRGKGVFGALSHLMAKKAVSQGFTQFVMALMTTQSKHEGQMVKVFSDETRVLWRHDYVLLERGIQL